VGFLKVLGWIFVPFIMIFVSWKKLKGAGKAFGVIWAAIIGLGLISNIINGGAEQPTTAPVSETEVAADEKKDDDVKVTAANAEKPNVEEMEKHKDAVLEFEKQMYAYEEEIKPHFDSYTQWMEALGNGQASINDVYSAANSAKEAANYARLALIKLPIDKELPKDVKDLLQESRTELSTAYYEKEKALKYVMEYLDEQKPSTMQKYKDTIELSETFILSGVNKLFQAKNAVGLELTEKAE
jgi:hypothetical protein